jgi:dienelactone hydrolase
MMASQWTISLVIMGLCAACAMAQSWPATQPTQEATTVSVPVRWNLDELLVAPAVHPAGQPKDQGVEGVFFDGLPLCGKPTRVFAWIGLPEGASADHKVPGMVLVHGGGGTAFAQWVRLWTARGYAAVAIDWGGCIPVKPGTPAPPQGDKPVPYWMRHEWAGPVGPSFDDVLDVPIEDQWNYHAVADIVLAHSLLRSMPQVDPARIGLVGISWGGYLTCLTASLDRRFALAISVYGSGFLGEESVWVPVFERIGPAKAGRWLELWDPSHYLPAVRLPMLWLGAPADQCYPFNTFSRSYRLPLGPRVVSAPVGLKHSHEDGWAPPEIYAYADSILAGGQGLAKIVGQGSRTDNGATTVWAKFEMPPGPARIVWKELAFTTDPGPWMKRRWLIAAPQMAVKDNTIRAALPAGATAYYINVIDSGGLCVSSELTDLGRAGQTGG